jgi:type I restriction enzyme M protein
MSGVEHVRIDTERNMLDVLDKVNAITDESIDPTHVFPLSQVYEGLLLKMGEKGNDGGQFFTPRQVIRALVQAIGPTVGEAVYDPCCGTAGMLAESYGYMRAGLGEKATAEQMETLKSRTFFGREKENLIYPVALANLILHGIDQPNIWHGNTLTGNETYGGLFEDAPALFDVILTNPPFGGKEGKEARVNFAYKTGKTQVLFLQHIIDKLKPGGRCGMVIDEGVLFRNETAFVQTKRKLLDDCDLWSVVSLPAGVFLAADRLRLLLSSLSIPAAIPSELTELSKWPNLADAPQVLTQVRNSIVHPQRKTKLHTPELAECWNLGLWLLELVLLRLFDHNGGYGKRLTTRFAGGLSQVPWAPKSPS